MVSASGGSEAVEAALLEFSSEGPMVVFDVRPPAPGLFLPTGSRPDKSLERDKSFCGSGSTFSRS